MHMQHCTCATLLSKRLLTFSSGGLQPTLQSVTNDCKCNTHLYLYCCNTYLNLMLRVLCSAKISCNNAIAACSPCCVYSILKKSSLAAIAKFGECCPIGCFHDCCQGMRTGQESLWCQRSLPVGLSFCLYRYNLIWEMLCKTPCVRLCSSVLHSSVKGRISSIEAVFKASIEYFFPFFSALFRKWTSGERDKKGRRGDDMQQRTRLEPNL